MVLSNFILPKPMVKKWDGNVTDMYYMYILFPIHLKNSYRCIRVVPTRTARTRQAVRATRWR